MLRSGGPVCDSALAIRFRDCDTYWASYLPLPIPPARSTVLPLAPPPPPPVSLIEAVPDHSGDCVMLETAVVAQTRGLLL